MRDLNRLLRPKSIAVIGGGFWCANVIEQCRKIGFEGELWAVHPKRDTFMGLPTVASVDDLPATPDAAYIGVNRDATIDVVQALGARGAGGAICFASGFREAQAELGDGAQMQDDLLAAAGDMPILGPNCYGLLNYLDRAALWPDQHGGVPVSSGVAIIMQSSNIAINLTMQTRALPIAYLVTVGNQAQIGMSQIGAQLLEDPRVTTLGLHIEGIDDLRGMEALAAKAKSLGKSIVALKVGTSVQAQAASISHTASLAGSDAGAQALFRRLGIGRARSLSGFLETLKLLHVAGPLASMRIAAASCSGGEASLMADGVVEGPLQFPPLTQKQSDDLFAALGPKVALANPLDYHTYIWGDEDALAATFTGLMQGDVAMGCVVLDFPRADRCDPAAWMPVITAVDRARVAAGKPMAILASLPETMPEPIAANLIARGLVPFSGISDAVEAMEIAAQLGQTLPDQPPVLLPGPAGSGKVLSEAEAKSALSAVGLQVPQAVRVASPAASGAAAADIGFPVVVKGEGIAHKTEAGAVVLNVRSAQAAEDAAAAMPTDNFLIEQMVTGTVAELLIGVVQDPAHGYVLTLAAGGQLTELLVDRTSLLVPAGRDEVHHALKNLRIWPVLDGYRGRPGADIDAIVSAVVAVQDYVAAERPAEVEINPLLCGTDAAFAADALIRLGGQDD